MSSVLEKLKASLLLHLLHKILPPASPLFFQGKCLGPNAALSKAADQVSLNYRIGIHQYKENGMCHMQCFTCSEQVANWI